MRFKFIACPFVSSAVIVDETHLVRAIFCPAEDQSPLAIYPDAVKALKSAKQGFKAVTRRRRKI
jgi:hypothetical protein